MLLWPRVILLFVGPVMGVYVSVGIKGAGTLVNGYGRIECLTRFPFRLSLGFSRVLLVLPESFPKFSSILSQIPILIIEDTTQSSAEI
jgi:hypothetical protein